MKTLKQIREASGGKEAYQKFFNSILKKFGVSSPSELEGKKKKEFFDAIDKGWDGDNEPKEKGEQIETYTDPDDLDPETTHNPDETELATGKKLGEKVKPPKQGDRDEYYRRVDKVDKAWGIGAGKKSLSDLSKGDLKKYFKDRDKALGHDIFDSVKKPNLVKVTETSDTEDEKLISEVFSKAQMKKAIGIARKSKGQYTKAYNAIEKIKKGLGDEHIIAAALKRANEAHEVGTDKYVKHCKKMVPGQNESVNEVVKAGRGNIKGVGIDLDATDYPGGEKQYVKDVKKRFKVTVKLVRYGADLSGKKADIIQFLFSDMYGGVEDSDIEDMWPELLEATTRYRLFKEAARNPNNPYVKKLSKPAQKVFHTVMYNILKKGIDPYSAAAHRAEVDLVGSGLNDKDLAAVKMAVQNESTVTIHISNELTEKLKAGKGKDSVGTDVDWDNVPDEKKWIKQAKQKYNVTLKKDVGRYHSGVDISGKKADIIKFLQGPMYGGVDDRDIEDMFPNLLEGVAVDRRTIGFKAALVRNEKAKKVREKSKLKKEKKKEQEVLDARYDYDGGVDVVLAAANKSIFGETAANSVASGNVDMAPNAGKKKKSLKVMRRDTY